MPLSSCVIVDALAIDFLIFLQLMVLFDFEERLWLYCGRFSHESVGEGEARHLVLERCSETSMYAIQW